MRNSRHLSSQVAFATSNRKQRVKLRHFSHWKTLIHSKLLLMSVFKTASDRWEEQTGQNRHVQEFHFLRCVHLSLFLHNFSIVLSNTCMDASFSSVFAAWSVFTLEAAESSKAVASEHRAEVYHRTVLLVGAYQSWTTLTEVASRDR